MSSEHFVMLTKASTNSMIRYISEELRFFFLIAFLHTERSDRRQEIVTTFILSFNQNLDFFESLILGLKDSSFTFVKLNMPQLFTSDKNVWK